jgi:hypothetical protein
LKPLWSDFIKDALPGRGISASAASAKASPPAPRPPGVAHDRGLLANMAKLRAGLELSTHGLKGKRPPVQELTAQALTSDTAPVCCPVYSPDAKTGAGELAEAGPEHADGTGTAAGDSSAGAGAADVLTGAGHQLGEHFAEALAMVARLPLTDAERAEAVRRLLTGTAKGKP